MPPRDWASTEHLNGLKIFWDGLTDVAFLRKTFRFRDKTADPPRECKVLPALFEYMRDPAGRPVPEWLWAEVRNWEARGPGDPRIGESRRRAGYELAIAWEAVARLMQYRAAREGGDAKVLEARAGGRVGGRTGRRHLRRRAALRAAMGLGYQMAPESPRMENA